MKITSNRNQKPGKPQFTMEDIAGLTSFQRERFYKNLDAQKASEQAEIKKRTAIPKSEKETRLTAIEQRISELGESKAGPFVERANQLRAEIQAYKTLADNLEKNSWYLENLAEWENKLSGKLEPSEEKELRVARQVFEQSGTDEAGAQLVDAISGVRLSVRRRDEIAVAEKRTDIQNRAVKLANEQAALKAEQAALDADQAESNPQTE